MCVRQDSLAKQVRSPKPSSSSCCTMSCNHLKEQIEDSDNYACGPRYLAKCKRRGICKMFAVSANYFQTTHV